MVASYSGHYECVKELIMQGAEINYQRQVQLVTGLVSDINPVLSGANFAIVTITGFIVCICL